MLFPPDVSLRMEGDRGAAQKLIPIARQLLSKALKMQETGGGVPVKLFQTLTDGSLVYCFLHGPVKHLYLQPASVAKEVPEEVLEDVGPPLDECANMLTGLVYPQDGIAISGGYSLHAFHPTTICAGVYQLSFAFQDVDRLGVESDPAVGSYLLQVVYPKPSMYSGAMKRLVQAIYGIGKTSVTADETTTATPVTVRNHYDYRWNKTHGIVKAAGSIWLIEVSMVNGVLAMPLPVFACTTSPGFASALAHIGDKETLAVVTEFGGLPTGDSFPVDTEAAIAAGKVYRLAPASALVPFYRNEELSVDKQQFFPACGWAFSETTGAAVNTCYWDSLASGEDYPFCELWRIDFVFTALRKQATLVPVESGLFNARYGTGTDNPVLYFPGDNISQGLFRAQLFGHLPPTKTYDVDSEQLIAPILAFYVGDELEVVRFRPYSGWRNVSTVLSGWKDSGLINYYVANIDPTYVIPSNEHPAEPPLLGTCPEDGVYLSWQYWTWQWLDAYGFPHTYFGGSDCRTGFDSSEPAVTYDYYFTTTNGWVMVDYYAVYDGWGYGAAVPPSFEGLYSPGTFRYDITGAHESPVAGGFVPWLSGTWKYTYSVLDRCRAFYGTSLNLYPTWEVRIEPSTGVYNATEFGVEVRLSAGLLETDFIDIGMLVPAGIREGYVLLRALRRYEHVPVKIGQAVLDAGSYPNGHDTETNVYDAIEAKAFLSGVGVVALANMGDLKPGTDYFYYDFLSTGAVQSTTRFKYAAWWADEWQFADLALPVLAASVSAGAGKNYLINATCYSYKTRFETDSIFVENIPCGMSKVDPRFTTFVGAV